MPLISVVVPVYKTERYIRQCVDSIINQTFKDYEIILVDDGSPDNCPSICDEYARANDRIKVVHKTNGGLVSARKAGVTASCGKYILAVDSDDFITEDYLQGFADAIEKNSADVISGNFCSYNEGNIRPFFGTIPSGLYTGKDLEEKIYDRMLSTEPFHTFGIFPSLWTKCIRRELVENNQKEVPENVRMGEDAMLSFACLLDATSLEVISNNGYMYRYNDSSITHSYDANMVTGCLSLIKYMSDLLKKKGWRAEDQLYSYTTMIQRLVIQNEMQRPQKGYANLKLWSKNPYVRKIWRTKCKLKLPLVNQAEAFAVRSGMLWILSMIKLAKRIKHKT